MDGAGAGAPCVEHALEFLGDQRLELLDALVVVGHVGQRVFAHGVFFPVKAVHRAGSEEGAADEGGHGAVALHAVGVVEDAHAFLAAD